MPDAISRSSLNQIASYGPPEELSSQTPTADAPTTKATLPATSDLHAAHALLEKTDKKQESYEKCIARFEKASIQSNQASAAAGGCAKSLWPGLVAGAGMGATGGAILGGAIACFGGAREAMFAAISGSALEGTIEGKIQCDDLPKKQ